MGARCDLLLPHVVGVVRRLLLHGVVETDGGQVIKAFAERFAAAIFRERKGNREIHITQADLAMFFEVAIQTFVKGIKK